MNTEIHPHRLFVSGSNQLSRPAVLLWHELGKRLASEAGLVVVTGGLRRMRDAPAKTPADWAIVEGVLEGLEGKGILPRERIETVLPDGSRDWDNLERFQVGKVRTLDHRNAQSRRSSMVNEAEVVVSIEGDGGTRSVLDVALAIDRPVLPLPFGGGASAECWEGHWREICQRFKISDATARRFARTKLRKLNQKQVQKLAAEVHRCVMRGFTRNCFVIMPFKRKYDLVFTKAICPALKAHGMYPLRMDKHIVTGNVITAIRDGLRHCYFAIADTTGDRPNVLYELGMAHGMGKPVIVLRRRARGGARDEAPFDIRVEHTLGYSKDTSVLRKRLIEAITRLRGSAIKVMPARKPQKP